MDDGDDNIKRRLLPWTTTAVDFAICTKKKSVWEVSTSWKWTTPGGPSTFSWSSPPSPPSSSCRRWPAAARSATNRWTTRDLGPERDPHRPPQALGSHYRRPPQLPAWSINVAGRNATCCWGLMGLGGGGRGQQNQPGVPTSQPRVHAPSLSSTWRVSQPSQSLSSAQGGRDYICFVFNFFRLIGRFVGLHSERGWRSAPQKAVTAGRTACRAPRFFRNCLFLLLPCASFCCWTSKPG